MSNITFSKIPMFIAADCWAVKCDGKLVGHITRVHSATFDYPSGPHYKLDGFDAFDGQRRSASLNELKQEIRAA